MSVNILIKRSDTASKRPDPNALFDGELALNFDAATGGLYYKDTNDEIVKIGPCQISATAPNSSPAGSPGNSLGELWFNTTSNGLFIWNGTSWVDVTTGIAVQTISGASPITVDNTDPTNPVVGIDAASTTQPGAVQLNDTVTSTSTTEAATANAVKTAYDKADAAIPNATFTAAGELIVGIGAGTYSVLTAGATDYILQSNGDGTLSWVENSVGDVSSVTGTAPIQVDNTDPQNPVISADAASTTASGVVQLNDTVTSTSTTEAATANAVKTAYDAALNSVQTVSGTAPIQVDNTDPQNLVVSADAATTSALGVVQVGTNIDVTAGTISVPAATTAAQGAVQVGTNIGVASGVISVANSSTSGKGVVQLNNSTNNSSTDLALTAAQGKALQDQIDALALTSNITLAGTYDASTGFMTTVTTTGIAAGFLVGAVPPDPDVTNVEYFIIVDVQGSVPPPFEVGGVTPYHIGDWFLSDGVVWTFLNLAFQAPAATTAVEGVVYLATDAEVQTGTDTSNKAVNPASLQAKVSDSTSTLNSYSIASSTAVKSAYDLANAAIPNSVFNAKGDIIVGTGNDTYGNFPSGTNGQILAADSAETFGVKWVDNTPDGVLGVTGTAPITVDNTDPQNPVIGASAASTSAAGVVQLYDGVDSTSSTEAATANAVKTAYDAAIAAGSSGLPTTGGIMTGNIVFTPNTTISYASTQPASISATDQLAVVVDSNFGGLNIVNEFDAGTY
jgi:hypothetical protein